MFDWSTLMSPHNATLDLICNMIDITVWLAKVQKFNLGQYYQLVRDYMILDCKEMPTQIQYTRHHRMPTSLENFNNYGFVLMRHPWNSLGT